jgi:hypothetical protein
MRYENVYHKILKINDYLLIGVFDMNLHDIELKKINKLVSELYLCICFDKGGIPPLEKVDKVFIPNATLINNSENVPSTYTIKQFVEYFKDRISKEGITSFLEREIANRTEIFGKIAHSFSTYETKISYNKRQIYNNTGINSIQMIKVDNLWFVNSLLWNHANEDRLLPKKYKK